MNNLIKFPTTRRTQEVVQLLANIRKNEIYLQELIVENADQVWISKVQNLVNNQKELLPYVKSGEISRIVYVKLQRSDAPTKKMQ